ncbi:hypothetical protein ACFWBF_23370 [Streptomyces sp. NPDC060028]|uniref:hypothetical protein n=1 Tax=Streptomyces sp. NPDC060028 TaxID=3347041 RepID=UPI00367B8647
MPAGLALALVVGVLWWWAVLRLVLEPADSGPVEGAVAVGGWGLGLLPVHCKPGPSARPRSGSGSGARSGGRWRGAGAGDAETAATRASTLHRSGEGSGPS